MSAETTHEERVKLNRQLAQMLKGGVIMDVTTPEQARRRGSGRMRRHGTRAHSRRYPRRRWRQPHERPRDLSAASRRQ